MEEIQYVHVKWKRSGADDMVPERSAPLLAKAGDLVIVDPKPGRYRRFKPNVPLGTLASPKRTKAAPQVVTEPAPAGAEQPEEATE